MEKKIFADQHHSPPFVRSSRQIFLANGGHEEYRSRMGSQEFAKGEMSCSVFAVCIGWARVKRLMVLSFSCMEQFREQRTSSCGAPDKWGSRRGKAEGQAWHLSRSSLCLNTFSVHCGPHESCTTAAVDCVSSCLCSCFRGCVMRGLCGEYVEWSAVHDACVVSCVLSCNC